MEPERAEAVENMGRAMRAALRAESGDFDRLTETLTHLRHMFHDEAAAALGPVINRAAAAMPMDTAEDKSRVCSWVNAVAHEHRLSLRCPSPPGLPALLTMYARHPAEDAGRFRFVGRDRSGRRFCSPIFDELPHLELIEDPLRPEHFSRDPRKGRAPGR